MCLSDSVNVSVSVSVCVCVPACVRVCVYARVRPPIRRAVHLGKEMKKQDAVPVQCLSFASAIYHLQRG